MKNGNPLNEVRMLCISMLNNNNLMCTDKTIKYVPDKSVLKYRPGDEIKLNEADFIRLYTTFLSEIEVKFAG